MPFWLGFWLLDSEESWASLSVTFKTTANRRHLHSLPNPQGQTELHPRRDRQQNSDRRELQLDLNYSTDQLQKLAGVPLSKLAALSPVI